MNPHDEESTQHRSLWPIVTILAIAVVALVASLFTGNCCGRV